MSSVTARTGMKKCPLCNGRLTKERSITVCTVCKEYFPDGTYQFNQVYGSKKSYTAKKINSLNIYGAEHKFCVSVDQLLKSDLNELEVVLHDFGNQNEVNMLAKFISQHAPLQTLNLALNDSEHLPIVLDSIEQSRSITNLSLYLYLDHQSTEPIGLMLKNNKSIRELKVEVGWRSEVLATFDFHCIFDGLSENSSIEVLHIQSNVKRPVKFGSNLKELNLYKFGSHEFFKDAFTHNTSIEQLAIYNANFNMVSAIKHNTSIKTLEIYRSLTEDDSFDRISEVLKIHPSLTSLKMEISPESTIDHIQVLCDGLKQSRSIRKVQFWLDPNSTVECMERLLSGVMQCKMLTEVALSRYAQRDPLSTEISSFTETLKDPQCALKLLNLKEFKFHTNQSLWLALTLEANRSLEAINIERTSLSSEALKVMQRWLVKNSQLKSIQFGDQFAVEDTEFDLAEIIKNNTALTTLHYLAPQSVSQTDKIVDALKANDTLTDLRISCNKTDFFARFVSEKLFDGQNTNLALRKLNFVAATSSEEKILERFTMRNIEYQSLMIMNTIVLIHNIVRDRSVFERLPRELWLLIFENVRYPGTTNFKSTAQRIIKYYLENK